MVQRSRHVRWLVSAAALLFVGTACASVGPVPQRDVPLPAMAQDVEIRRTSYGVPHILAPDLRGAAFALAYVQLEDHGAGIIEGMQAARGQMALVEGERRIDADARARLRAARARDAFELLGDDTRQVYEGFAAGMNHFIRVNSADLPDWMEPDFTAEDVLTRDVVWPNEGTMNRFRARLLEDPARSPIMIADSVEWSHPRDDAQNVGSNAWALAPSRTTSGNAILLRNPHLSWTAGYYEAHVRVPGVLDFYGDFRIGGPFTIIGGFNRDLGFSTTNNATRSHEFYALRADDSRADHVRIDGAAVPLEREIVTVEYRDGNDVRTATREFWSSPFGPVVHRADSLVYIYRQAAAGDYRAGEQWLAMMKARSLAEWQDAMRIEARTSSNFTYADRAGNILYIWVSGAPILPHAPGGDTLAIMATQSSDIWSRRAPFDSLPQLLNPPGGYLRNENDSPHYTNLNVMMGDSFPFWMEPRALRMRSQHSLQLLHNDRLFSLEDVVDAKHSMRMLLADRVKPDLLAAVAAAGPAGEVARAAELIAVWDNTAAAASRGGVLFEVWWNRYRALMRDADLYAVDWTPAEPVTTPRGLANAERAAAAFTWAVTETARRYGAWDVAWGDVHRVRRGDVDVPVGGCGGALGCFRVLNFETADDGRRVVDGGDGWVIAVEFGDEPRARSVLAYGQSPDPNSPYHDDQAALFAGNGMKTVRWTEADIAADIVERYRPGERIRGTAGRR